MQRSFVILDADFPPYAENKPFCSPMISLEKAFLSSAIFCQCSRSSMTARQPAIHTSQSAANYISKKGINELFEVSVDRVERETLDTILLSVGHHDSSDDREAGRSHRLYSWMFGQGTIVLFVRHCWSCLFAGTAESKSDSMGVVCQSFEFFQKCLTLETVRG